MKKKLLIILFSLVLTITCVHAEESFVLTTSSESTSYNETSDNPYDIKNYDINMILTETHILSVNEVVQIHFNRNDNCVIKYIPNKGVITRKDGTKATYMLTMKNFKSNYSYEISTVKNDYKILICTDEVREEDKNIIMNYELVYDNSLNGEFNYNILDSRWDAKVNKVTFMINYPKTFDENNLEVLVNDHISDNIKIDGLRVSGEIRGLEEKSTIVLRSILDKEYFVKRNDLSNYNWIIVLIMVINVICVYFIWRKNGKDLKLVDTIELKPFDEYNPLELGYISTECSKVTDKMIFSLIIYLANKGYIKMERKLNSILLTKVKDYEGDNEIERLLMKRLFLNSNEFNYTDGNRVYRKIAEKIRHLVDTRQNKVAIMERQPLYVKLVPFILGVTNILLTAYIVLYGRSLLLIITTILLSIIGFALLTYSLTVEDDDLQTAIMWISILLIFASGFESTFSIITSNIANIVYYFIGVLTFCMIMLLIYLMPKRSKEGNLLMSRSINFREFLRTPNDDLLGKLMKENKNYIYDVISYAYAFGVEGEFLDSYNRLRGYVNEPKWYKDTTE